MGLKTSFGSPNDSKQLGPGPGQYQQNGVFKSISYSFGIKTGLALDNGKNSSNPGPGTYNMNDPN